MKKSMITMWFIDVRRTQENSNHGLQVSFVRGWSARQLQNSQRFDAVCAFLCAVRVALSARSDDIG